jgi:hypothetical protein
MPPKPTNSPLRTQVPDRCEPNDTRPEGSIWLLRPWAEPLQLHVPSADADAAEECTLVDAVAAPARCRLYRVLRGTQGYSGVLWGTRWYSVRGAQQ